MQSDVGSDRSWVIAGSTLLVRSMHSIDVTMHNNGICSVRACKNLRDFRQLLFLLLPRPISLSSDADRCEYLGKLWSKVNPDPFSSPVFNFSNS